LIFLALGRSGKNGLDRSFLFNSAQFQWLRMNDDCGQPEFEEGPSTPRCYEASRCANQSPLR
jgi:hypothetical protein